MLIHVDGRAIEVTNPDKVILEPGITKGDLAEYHRRIGPTMLPHVEGRLLTVQRFPDGVGAGGFYQKDTPDHYPEWIDTVTVPKRGGQVTHVVVRDVATLVFLANLAAVTLHVGLQRVEHLDRPDRLVLDLDPPEDAEVGRVRSAARVVRSFLDELGLASRLMATGSKGYHVVVPLVPEAPFEEVKAIARRMAETLEARHPGLTSEQRIAARDGRVFVDFLRNAVSQTAVAPYSVRARPGGPVAAPIRWDELGRVRPGDVTMGNVFRRLGQVEDPWAVDAIEPQSLSGVGGRLGWRTRKLPVHGG